MYSNEKNLKRIKKLLSGFNSYSSPSNFNIDDLISDTESDFFNQIGGNNFPAYKFNAKIKNLLIGNFLNVFLIEKINNQSEKNLNYNDFFSTLSFSGMKEIDIKNKLFDSEFDITGVLIDNIYLLFFKVEGEENVTNCLKFSKIKIDKEYENFYLSNNIYKFTEKKYENDPFVIKDENDENYKKFDEVFDSILNFKSDNNLSNIYDFKIIVNELNKNNVFLNTKKDKLELLQEFRIDETDIDDVIKEHDIEDKTIKQFDDNLIEQLKEKIKIDNYDFIDLDIEVKDDDNILMLKTKLRNVRIQRLLLLLNKENPEEEYKKLKIKDEEITKKIKGKITSFELDMPKFIFEDNNFNISPNSLNDIRNNMVDGLKNKSLFMDFFNILNAYNFVKALITLFNDRNDNLNLPYEFKNFLLQLFNLLQIYVLVYSKDQELIKNTEIETKTKDIDVNKVIKKELDNLDKVNTFESDLNRYERNAKIMVHEIYPFENLNFGIGNENNLLDEINKYSSDLFNKSEKETNVETKVKPLEKDD